MSRPIHIILVADLSDDTEAMRLALTAGGLDVVFRQIETSLEFVRALESELWHLVISNYAIEKFGAVDVLNIIRKYNAEIPVIVVATPADEQNAVDAMGFGAADYVLKNDLRRLAPIVAREVRGSELRSGYQMARDVIAWQAGHDLLTGLDNREQFNARLRTAVQHATETGGRIAVFFLDLDHFKQINDTLGFRIGDEVLQNIANRLKNCLPPDQAVARGGSDEFKVFVTGIESPDQAADLGRMMIAALGAPLNIQGEELYITASIGVSVFPNDAKDAEVLLHHADLAVNRAKEQHAVVCVFRQTNYPPNFSAPRLASKLRKAIDREDLKLYYQPQVNLASGRINAFEALLRWNTPDLGNISPAEFIPLAEDNGLIVPIGRWVIHEACRQASRWVAEGHPVRIFVNLSARQLHDTHLIDTVASALSETGLNPSLLGFELTETALFTNYFVEKTPLSDLNNLGVCLALDDFGVGYSSLSLLRHMPVRFLKIDRMFISGFVENEKDQALVRSIIYLGHSLGLQVVAEGVFAIEQSDLLTTFGCDIIQGFLESPAVPEKEAKKILIAYNAGSGRGGVSYPNSRAAEPVAAPC